jgi:hypothetical protein
MKKADCILQIPDVSFLIHHGTKASFKIHPVTNQNAGKLVTVQIAIPETNTFFLKQRTSRTFAIQTKY